MGQLAGMGLHTLVQFSSLQIIGMMRYKLSLDALNPRLIPTTSGHLDRHFIPNMYALSH